MIIDFGHIWGPFIAKIEKCVQKVSAFILQQLPIDQAAQAEGCQQMIAKKKSVPLQPTQVDEKPPGQYHHPQHLDQLDLHKKELHHHQQRLSEPGRAHHEPPDVRQPRHHGGHPML